MASVPGGSTASISPTLKPVSTSLPLPLAPHTTLHVQLTRLATSTLLFLTTRTPGDSAASSPLGSFVYAIPSVRPAPSTGPTA